MNTPFDGVRAVREEIQGLGEVMNSLKVTESRLETQIGQAEVELNSYRKITGFVRMEIERKRTVLKQLEDAANG